MTSKTKSLKIALYLLLLTLIPLQSMAQETEDFSPDAPGATTGVSIMPQGKIDWETGIGLEWDRRMVNMHVLSRSTLLCSDSD